MGLSRPFKISISRMVEAVTGGKRFRTMVTFHSQPAAPTIPENRCLSPPPLLAEAADLFRHPTLKEPVAGELDPGKPPLSAPLLMADASDLFQLSTPKEPVADEIDPSEIHRVPPPPLMADTSDLSHLPTVKEPIANDLDRPESRRLPLPSFWSITSSVTSDGDPDPDPFVSVFSSGLPFPHTGSDYSDDDKLSLDLFRRRRSPSSSISGASMDPFSDPLPPPVFSVCDGLEEIRSSCGFGYRLGLRLGIERGEVEEENDTGYDPEREMVVPGWSMDDFFVGRRSSPSESIESTVDPGGLRVVALDSDSDTDEQIVAVGIDSVDNDEQYRVLDDSGFRLRLDSLQLTEGRQHAIEEFVWEDGVLSLRAVGYAGASSNGSTSSEIGEMESDEVMHEDLADWEDLLAMNNIVSTAAIEPEYYDYFDEEEDIVYTSNYESFEVLVGQLADHDGEIRGSPPAAKSVVENLPTVVLTKEDSANIDTVCAICKDEIIVEDRLKRLPCFHHFHEGCILPWLGMRNTCPLCRFELLTDDSDYEARRAASVVSGDVESCSSVFSKGLKASALSNQSSLCNHSSFDD
ncbi:hypothetical protein Cni_G22569 [Canna indica]|uniref:RING-type E3 ubiquitin transferase n=1 Tax=Canna indica TaxID=4628 RepID=A0AAQ3KSU7_9LILI|nr:hypothetical protein Cni_G22569 [Canna indica]